MICEGEGFPSCFCSQQLRCEISLNHQKYDENHVLIVVKEKHWTPRISIPFMT